MAMMMGDRFDSIRSCLLVVFDCCYCAGDDELVLTRSERSSRALVFFFGQLATNLFHAIEARLPAPEVIRVRNNRRIRIIRIQRHCTSPTEPMNALEEPNEFKRDV